MAETHPFLAKTIVEILIFILQNYSGDKYSTMLYTYIIENTRWISYDKCFNLR